MVDSKAMGPTLVDGKAVGGADILDVIIDPSQTEISDGEPDSTFWTRLVEPGVIRNVARSKRWYWEQTTKCKPTRNRKYQGQS